MPFSQIFPPSPSPTESIRLFYTSVSGKPFHTLICSKERIRIFDLLLMSIKILFQRTHKYEIN